MGVRSMLAPKAQWRRRKWSYVRKGEEGGGGGESSSVRELGAKWRENQKGGKGRGGRAKKIYLRISKEEERPAELRFA